MGAEDPLMIATEKGLTAFYRGVNLYPPEDPRGYARKRASSARIPPQSLVFVPSLGLGHGLSELLERLPEGSAILCVEWDQRIMALASSLALPEDPRLIVIRTESEAAVAEVLKRMRPGQFRRVVELPLSAGYRLNQDFYSKIADLLSSEIRDYWRNRLTLIGLGSLWVRNLLDNLPLLTGNRDLGQLKTDHPVVVAGAGPSLEASIPFLRENRGKFFLIAVDTALPVLAAHALAPQLVMALEAQPANLTDFLPFRDPSIPLACDLTSSPLALRLFRRNLFFFSSSFAPIRLLERLSRAGLLPDPLPALGSVGAVAVKAALGLSGRDIFVTGLDFSYPQGRMHSRGAPTHIEMLVRTDRIRPVDHAAYTALAARAKIHGQDKNGRPILTDVVMKSYRDGLSRILAQEGQGRAWDIGPSGLPLGIKAVSPGEAAEMLSGTSGIHDTRTETRVSFPENEIREFLRGEKALLKRASDRIRSLLSTGSTGALSRDDRELLKEIDYAYIHFPDESDEKAPNRSFLARALVAAEYYATRIERICGSAWD
jgi:hypothetical protein